MKKKLVLWAVTWLLTPLCAQEQRGFLNRTAEYPQINPPSAACFHRYVDQPVSTYTGTPDITVPLITLEDGRISLPVALRSTLPVSKSVKKPALNT